MKKTLLSLLLVLAASISFSQPIANTPPDIFQCMNEVFDLTQFEQIILGNQNPAEYSVTYYLTESDAHAGTNPIINPQFFIGGQNQFIIVRLTEDATSLYDLTGFTVGWGQLIIGSHPDVSACDSYILPPLAVGNYYIFPGGNGMIIPAGTQITGSQTIYIYATQDGCIAEDEFTVTIQQSPVLDQLPNATSCTSYILPELTIGDFYTLSGGQGVVVPGGTAITQSTVLYQYAAAGDCISEQTLEITIGEVPINTPAPIIVCDDGDGVAEFNLISVIDEIRGGNFGIEITFYENMADAQAGANPITELFGYSSATDVIIARGEDFEGCMSYVEVVLVVESCTDNVIIGVVQFDADGDGCTEDDPPAANISVVCVNGNDVMWAYTNSNGEFVFTNVEEGSNIIEVGSLPAGYSNPGSQTVVVEGENSVTSVNFCLGLAPPSNDVAIYVYPQGAARPGLPLTYTLYLANFGNTTVSGTATFTYDADRLTFFSSNPVAASHVGNLLTFNFEDLSPLEGQMIFVDFSVAVPPAADLGDILIAEANVSLSVSDADLSNNTSIAEQTIVNSLDPNDISVLEGPTITEEQADGYLNYIVRFQNVGNAAAINVRIENELSEYLNWNTFVPVASSHSYLANRIGSTVVFNFDNINLPGTSDEPNSHGFIAYKVKPVADFAEGEVISNAADIYFDFNAPIATNTVTTQIGSLGTPESGLNALRVYPNPASDIVNILSNVAIDKISVSDMSGKVVIVETGVNSIDVSILESGIYLMQVETGSMRTVRKLFID